jgi:hypothetical protein
MKYRLAGAVSGELPVMGHRYEFALAANRTTPQSEEDEAVFEWLVMIGYAERVPETPEDKARIEAEETPLKETATTEEEK